MPWARSEGFEESPLNSCREIKIRNQVTSFIQRRRRDFGWIRPHSNTLRYRHTEGQTIRRPTGRDSGLAKGQSLKLDIFLDRSVVEVFANRQACVPAPIFTTAWGICLQQRQHKTHLAGFVGDETNLVETVMNDSGRLSLQFPSQRRVSIREASLWGMYDEDFAKQDARTGLCKSHWAGLAAPSHVDLSVHLTRSHVKTQTHPKRRIPHRRR